MSEDFIKLVASMREAQKKYFQLVVSKDAFMRRAEISKALGEAKRCESAVDRWLVSYKDGVRQLLLTDLTNRTDESAGVYDTDVNVEKKESANK